MTQLSPTALEMVARAVFSARGWPDAIHPAFEYEQEDWEACATAAITAYLAQAEKEGWVMVPRADIVEVRESMEQMDGTFDPETSDYALYHRLDVLLHPELIGYAAAQNGGEPCK